MVVGLLAMSDGFARGDGTFANSVAAAKRTELRPAAVLAEPGTAMRRRPLVESAPAERKEGVADETPALRLQRSLMVNIPAAGAPAKPTLPGGELNRDGVVRAGRLEIRDGSIFLESDRKTPEDAVQAADTPGAAALQ